MIALVWDEGKFSFLLHVDYVVKPAFQSFPGYMRNLMRIPCPTGLFFFLVFLPFLGPLSQHMEVPRLGVQLEL